MNKSNPTRRVSTKRIIGAAVAGIATAQLMSFVPVASGATNYFWSGNGTTQGGPGAWDIVNPHFGPSGGPFTTVWDNSLGDSATFDSATAATAVTMGGALTVSSLTFGTNFYTLGNGNGIVTAANTLNFVGNAGTVTTNHVSGTTTLTAFLNSQTLTKSGPGRLEINNSGNSTSSKWVLAGGALTAPAQSRFGTPNAGLVQDFFTFDGGGLGTNTTTAYDMGVNRGVTILAGGAFIGSSATSVILTFGAPVVGTAGGNLTIAGSSAQFVGSGHTTSPQVLLTNTNNSWNGNAFLAAGALRVGASGVIPDTASINIMASATTFDLNGFTETVRTIAGTAGTVAVGAGSVIVANPNGETFTSVISSTAAGKVTKNGTGAWSLSGGSTGFNGEFILNSGTLGVGGSNIFGNASNTSTVTINGGTLSNTGTAGRTIPAPIPINLNVDIVADDSLFNSSQPGQVLFNGPATIRDANRIFTINGLANLGFADLREDVAGRTVTKDGSGTLALTGNNIANAFTGDVTVLAGRLQVNSTSIIGTGSNTIHLSGGALNTSANRSVSADPITNPINVTADSAITNTSTALTVNLNLSSSTVGGSAGTLTFRNDGAAGTGVFEPRFSGGNFDFTRPIVIAEGLIDTFRTTRLSFFNDGPTVQTFSGLISGPGSIRRSNGAPASGGDTILTAANTYSGGTQLSEGGLGLPQDTVGTGLGVTSGPLGTGPLVVAPTGSNAKLFSVGGPRVLGNNILFTGSPLVTAGDFDITLSGDVDLGSGNRSFLVNNASTTVSGVISGTTGITKLGTGTATLTGTNLYAGATWVDGGVLSVSSSANLGDETATNSVALFSGTLLATAPLASAMRNVHLNNGGTIESAHAVSFGNVAGSGSLTKAGTGTLTVNHVRGDNLAVNAGRIQIVQNQSDAGVSILNTIAIGATEALDVTNNHLVSHVTPVGTWNGSSYDGLTGQISSGRNGNALPLWDGPGLITSMSDATGGNFTSIGIATGTEVLISRGLTAADTLVWAGQTISAGDALVMYTYGGDANLDGKLNIDDYVAIDQGVASALTGWSNGDFNYDGKVNIDDYTTVIDSNIGNQVLGQFYNAGGIGGGSGVSAVPEPTGLFAVGLGALGWLGRRRRKNEKALQS